MEYYGKGPLLSAKELDIDLAWERARQMQRVCEEVLPQHPGQVLVLETHAAPSLPTSALGSDMVI